LLRGAAGMRNLDSQTDETLDVQPDENRRAERRLARGLEDVSYLFLSQTPDESPEKTEGQSAPSAPPHATHSPTITALQASSAINRDMLLSLLSRNAAVLENGMRAIDGNMSCDPFGSIDLLALDGLDQFVIIDIDIVQNDASLLRGIGHFDWFIRNTQILRRMYQGRVINFSAQPRLFLVAPDFSPLLKCAAKRSVSPKISCFGYHAAAISGGVGVLFESVCM
jgi:hypothetical protein